MNLRDFAFLCAAAIPVGAAATDYHLYYLGGQSNMDGYGKVEELPEDQRGPVQRARIFQGNPARDGSPVDGRGLWSQLQPGHGAGFSSDGETNHYSDRFGVELTLARRLLEAHPDRHIAFIKYSRGGTSIAAEAARDFGCWEPDFNSGDGEGTGVNQYDHFLETLHNALRISDIDGDGSADRLIPAGIVWMQGESDAALDIETARAYGKNLAHLMELVRAALHRDDAPLAVGRISDSGQDDEDGIVWDFGDVVREQQRAFVEADGAAALVVATDDYGYSDPWHYDSDGYLDLGRRFAEALLKLERDD
jgi:hypothetical protein